MMDRRLFLGGMAGMAGMVSGCYTPPDPVALSHPLDLGVDAHIHLFNGRDVPAYGFLKQVVLGGEGTPLPSGVPVNSLMRLLLDILRMGTPSARQELEGIAPRGRADDQRSVAMGIDAFRGAGGARTTARMASPDMSDDDALLLAMIQAEASGEPLPDLGARAMRRTAPPEAGIDGAALAALIYEGPAASAMAAPSAARRRAALSPSSLISTIQWAGLLTRGRRDLLAEVIRLYGGDGGKRIQIFVASLVDLEYWLDSRAEDAGWLSPQDAQIAVMSAIARERKDTLILNFAPFCPLRAVVEGPQTLRRVQGAIARQGFAGVKLYPPMGFRATCNDGIGFGHSRYPTGVTGAQIDRALDQLYAWCAAEEVPIQAHANDSMAAARGTGAYASPVYWRRVLERYPALRLNLSHAGHFGAAHDIGSVPTVCGIRPERDWLAVIAQMMGAGRQVWFDTGYWTEVTLATAERPAAITRLRELAALSGDPALFARRILYGSDWTMIAREPGFNAYLRGMEEFARALYPDPARFDAMMGGNALDFILGPGRKQHDRLGAFFADNVVWRGNFAA